MEILLKKMRRAMLILESQLKSLTKVTDYLKRLQQSHQYELVLDNQRRDCYYIKFQQCLDIAEINLRDLGWLLHSTESTKSLVSHLCCTFNPLCVSHTNGKKLFKILDHRNDAVIHNNGSSLKNLAHKSSYQSELMLSMAEVTRYDSRTVRIITFIAMIYLPVNLVSVGIKGSLLPSR